jgi:hypothetical protein
MVNNSTNINKTNNYLSTKTIEHKKDHDIWNLNPGLGQEQKCGRAYSSFHKEFKKQGVSFERLSKHG